MYSLYSDNIQKHNLKEIISNKNQITKKHSDCLNCLINCAEYRLTLKITQNPNNGRNTLFLFLQDKNIPSPFFFYDKSSNEVIELIEKNNISEIKNNSEKCLDVCQNLNTENDIIKTYDQNKKNRILLFNYLKFPLVNINSENNKNKKSTILILDDGKYDMLSNYSINSYSYSNLSKNYCLLFDIHNLNNIAHLFSIQDIKDSKEIKIDFNSSIHGQQLFKNNEIFYISPISIINSIKERMEQYTKLSDKEIRENLYNKYFFCILKDKNMDNIGILFSFDKTKDINNIKLNGEYIMNENYKINKIFICVDMWINTGKFIETSYSSKTSSSKQSKTIPEYINEENINYNNNDNDNDNNNYNDNYNDNDNYNYNNNYNNNNYNNNYYNNYNYNNISKNNYNKYNKYNDYSNNYNNNLIRNNGIYSNKLDNNDNNNFTIYNNSINNNYYNKYSNNVYDTNYIYNNDIDNINTSLNNQLNFNNSNYSKFSFSNQSNPNNNDIHYFSKNEIIPNENNYNNSRIKFSPKNNNNSTNKFDKEEVGGNVSLKDYYELNTLLNNLHLLKNSENSFIKNQLKEGHKSEVNNDKVNENLAKSVFLLTNQEYIKEIFSKYKEGNCISNYTILKNKIDIKMNVDKERLKKIKLHYYFDCFKDINYLSLNIPYITKKGKLLFNELNPTLSSLRLVLKTKKKIARKIVKQKKDNFNIKLKDNIIKIEYEEIKPPYERDLLYMKIDDIKQIIEGNKLTFKNVLLEKSFFCILWSLTNSSSLFNTSFLAYYSFDFKLIGIFIIKLNPVDWLTSFSNDIKNYKDYKKEYNKNIENIKEWFNNLPIDKDDGFYQNYFTNDYIHYIQSKNN